MSTENDKSGLLDRDSFRNGVLLRDGHKCVACGASGVRLDAHHIIERRLWDDGGYYLDNGATLCDEVSPTIVNFADPVLQERYQKSSTGCHMKAASGKHVCPTCKGKGAI